MFSMWWFLKKKKKLQKLAESIPQKKKKVKLSDKLIALAIGYKIKKQKTAQEFQTQFKEFLISGL